MPLTSRYKRIYSSAYVIISHLFKDLAQTASGKKEVKKQQMFQDLFKQKMLQLFPLDIHREAEIPQHKL